MKYHILIILLLVACLFQAGCSNGQISDQGTVSSAESYVTPDPSTGNATASIENAGESVHTEDVMQNDLGSMTPEDALDYMKETENLVIVDVAATRWYYEETFKGAINIPIEELGSEEEDALYMDIPQDRPVLLHCRRGMIVPGAYERVKELRPDIPEISYIDGAPLFDEYNQWFAETQQGG